jgi:hypothetical protein
VRKRLVSSSSSLSISIIMRLVGLVNDDDEKKKKKVK